MMEAESSLSSTADPYRINGFSAAASCCVVSIHRPHAQTHTQTHMRASAVLSFFMLPSHGAIGGGRGCFGPYFPHYSTQSYAENSNGYSKSACYRQNPLTHPDTVLTQIKAYSECARSFDTSVSHLYHGSKHHPPCRSIVLSSNHMLYHIGPFSKATVPKQKSTRSD